MPSLCRLICPTPLSGPVGNQLSPACSHFHSGGFLFYQKDFFSITCTQIALLCDYALLSFKSSVSLPYVYHIRGRMNLEVVMRRLLLVSVFLFSLPLSPCSALDDWREYGPPGGAMLSLISDSSHEVFIAATSTQVYRSYDTGLNWEALPSMPDASGIKDAVLVGDSESGLMVCTNTNGIYRWDPSSQSWLLKITGIQSSSPYALQFFDLSVVTSTSTRVFVGCSTGLYYSDNRGDQWYKITLPYENTSPQYKMVTQVQAARDGSVYVYTYTPIRIESDLVTASYFVMKPGLPSTALSGAMIWPNPNNANELVMIFNGIYYSTDRGENWSSPSAGQVPPSPVAVDWLYGKPTVFGVTSTCVLNRSTLAWSRLWSRSIRTQYRAVERDTVSGHLLIASQSRGVWRSNDMGQTWTYSSNGMSAYGAVYAVGVDPANSSIVYAGMQTEGVWRTKDDGATWEERNTGFDSDPAYSVSIRSIAVDPVHTNHLLAGTETQGGTPAWLYQSQDSGQHWTKVSTGPTGLAYCIFFVPSNPSVILVGTGMDGIWRSPDDGVTWSRVADKEVYRNVLDFAQEKGGRIFTALIGGFNPTNGYGYSDNTGTTWNVVEESASCSLAADPVRAGRVMRGTGWWDAGAGMLYTSSNGTKWDAVNTGLPTRVYGYDMADSTVADPNHSGTYYTFLPNSGVFETENDGANWTQVGTLTEGNTLEFSTRKQGTLFVGRGYEGIWYYQTAEAMPTPTPSVSPTPNVTPTYTPPPWFPPMATKTPTIPAQPNVGAADDATWFSPTNPKAGESVSVGSLLFNNSTTAVSNIRVDFYVGTDLNNLPLLSTVTVPSLAARSRLPVQSVSNFLTPTAGTYYVKVKIDPLNAVSEYDETDNEVQTAFYARFGGADKTPPTGSIRIDSGSLFTYDMNVHLDLNTTDTGSGVGYMYVTGWVYDPRFGGLAKYYESGWIDYLASASFLIEGGYFEALSVTYADLDENVSDTYWAVTNYYPTEYTEFVFWDESLYYPMYLTTGANVTLTVNHVFGDSDLYVIAPSTPDGYYDWSSVHDGITTENISFTAPETGVYWTVVFGYDFSEYRLLCSGSMGSKELVKTPSLLAKGTRRSPDFNPPPVDTELPEKILIPSFSADLYPDGTVDYKDLFKLSRLWGKAMGDAGYDARLGGVDTDHRIGGTHLLQWLGIRR